MNFLPEGNYRGYLQNHTPKIDEIISRIEPNTPCGEFFRRYWHPVALTSEVEQEPLPVKILGENLVLFRTTKGEYGLVHQQCPHRNASLIFGKCEKEGIRCCYHGWLFAPDGEILETPGEETNSTAAKNINLNSNDSIMVLSEQFPSNYYIWEQLAIKTNATLSVVPRPEDDDWTTNILNTIDDSVKIISLSNNHWTDGGYIDLEKISNNISNSDIALLIDGTQSVGAMPIDVEKINPDFLVVSGYKWLLGPYNLGLCYINPKYHDGDPLEYWWGHKEGADNPTSLINYYIMLIKSFLRKTNQNYEHTRT